MIRKHVLISECENGFLVSGCFPDGPGNMVIGEEKHIADTIGGAAAIAVFTLGSTVAERDEKEAGKKEK